ncbi:hypothetical protein [Ktedonobacter racemifer]|uniref:Uncharacterized protein n=1 Tax=Ktedonobacter racemifer DSM 44963 TaxID=485913 RepID=D6TIU7_KTERA|nr:hypothetical protein [Ktedonobacter racemifer]EFH89354.1 hypothetical protein Krac_10904 [Ktedonobacter racemifer DSM 44963]
MQLQQMHGQSRAGWLDRTIQSAGHTVFRIVSIIFSLASAHAIYWFFSALNGVDALQQYVTVTISLGFVALGYFVTRGLAHRMMQKQSIWSYLLIGILYVFVEVVCNFGEAAARGPDIQWVHALTGWQFSAFVILLPLVLSIIPLFNLALACIDVDLMRERLGMAPTVAVKNATMAGVPTVQMPQTAYPPMPKPTQGNGGGNNLGNFWNKARGGKPPVVAMNGNGSQSKP